MPVLFIIGWRLIVQMINMTTCAQHNKTIKIKIQECQRSWNFYYICIMNDNDIIRRGASSFDELAGWCRLSMISRNKTYPCIPMMKISRGQNVFMMNAECIRCAHRMYLKQDPLRTGWTQIYGVNKNNLFLKTRIPVPAVKSAGRNIININKLSGMMEYSKRDGWHTSIHD